MQLIDNNLFTELLQKAADSERRRANFDLRGSAEDGSQRMLNALMPDTVVPVHRHPETPETVVCLMGEVEEVFYEPVEEFERDEVGNTLRRRSLREVTRRRLAPLSADSTACGIQVPAGVWHTLVALKPSVIIEFKDGKYAPPSPDNIL